MVILDIVLRDFALVDFGLLCQEIHGVGLLQERIALVLFVAENTADGGNAPFILAAGSRKFPPRQFLGDGVAVMPICVALEKYSRILLQRLSSFAEPL